MKAKSQASKFKEAARELECDDNEAALEDRLRRIATPPKKADKKEPAPDK